MVHGKGSLLTKMPGDDWQRRANLRALLAWMWAHPGKQLLFMGGDIGQEREWSEGRSLDWHLLDDPGHAGIQHLVRSLNAVAAERQALWQVDNDGDGFAWIDASDNEQSVLSFVREGRDATVPVVCVANLTPVPRHGYRLGLPDAGSWREVLNTDAADFGGSGVVNGVVETEPIAWHGYGQSANLTPAPARRVLVQPVAVLTARFVGSFVAVLTSAFGDAARWPKLLRLAPAQRLQDVLLRA